MAKLRLEPVGGGAGLGTSQPVAFALALLGTGLIVLKGLPLALIPTNLFGALIDFVLLAVPLFLLMSNIQLRGGVGRALPTVLLAVVMLGGIYAGAFTPTEASAIGATIALAQRSLSWENFLGAVKDSVQTATVVFLIVVGAKVFGQAVTLYQIPQQVAHIFDTHVPVAVGFIIIVSLILLFLESLSMLLIMMPVLLPTVLALGIDPIWFGVYFALITPPVGLNLFVIQTIANKSLGVVIRGVVPFVALMLGVAVLLSVCPQIVLWLPFNL